MNAWTFNGSLIADHDPLWFWLVECACKLCCRLLRISRWHHSMPLQRSKLCGCCLVLSIVIVGIVICCHCANISALLNSCLYAVYAYFIISWNQQSFSQSFCSFVVLSMLLDFFYYLTISEHRWFCWTQLFWVGRCDKALTISSGLLNTWALGKKVIVIRTPLCFLHFMANFSVNLD